MSFWQGPSLAVARRQCRPSARHVQTPYTVITRCNISLPSASFQAYQAVFGKAGMCGVVDAMSITQPSPYICVMPRCFWYSAGGSSPTGCNAPVPNPDLQLARHARQDQPCVGVNMRGDREGRKGKLDSRRNMVR